MFGKAAITAIVCVSNRFASMQAGICQKLSRYVASDLTCECVLEKLRQRLFPEIVIWRRLSHPNVLPVFGVSPQLFPLCIITEWMVDGNILDFTSKHPEVNRLRLVRPTSVLFFDPDILKYL